MPFAPGASLPRHPSKKPGTRPLAGWGREQTQTLAEMNLGPVTLSSTLVVCYSNVSP